MKSQLVSPIVGVPDVAPSRPLRPGADTTARTRLLAGIGLFLALAASGAGAQPGTAAKPPGPSVFSTPYVSEGQPAAEQARIVYYRVKPASEPIFAVGADHGDNANVYVDGEFQTALLPGGFSTFCVAAGEHRLGAFIGDEPRYAGKAEGSSVRLDGSNTYFFRVRNERQAAAIPVARAEAEAELQQARRQNHVISRASSVVPCREQVAQAAPVAAPPSPQVSPAPPAKDTEAAAQAEVLFAFARSDVPGLPDAHPLLRLIEQFQHANGASTSIEVIGYADTIGSDASAVALGLARAHAVRALLIRRGIPASAIRVRSSGNLAPVATHCSVSDLDARIACNAPNRRVVVRVAGR